jgi:hypothetical protein
MFDGGTTWRTVVPEMVTACGMGIAGAGSLEDGDAGCEAALGGDFAGGFDGAASTVRAAAKAAKATQKTTDRLMGRDSFERGVYVIQSTTALYRLMRGCTKLWRRCCERAKSNILNYFYI